MSDMKTIRSFVVGVSLIDYASAVTGAELMSPVYGVVCLFKDSVEKIIGALAALLFLYAGIKWITAEGVEEQLHARDIVIYTILGLVLLGLVSGITLILFPSAALSCI